MLHQLTLLFGRLYRNKPHGWTAHRLTDRFSIGRIVLVALDVSLHVLRRHQTNLMPELCQLTRPIVRGGTSFHADKTWRQGFEERYHLATT